MTKIINNLSLVTNIYH